MILVEGSLLLARRRKRVLLFAMKYYGNAERLTKLHCFVFFFLIITFEVIELLCAVLAFYPFNQNYSS